MSSIIFQARIAVEDHKDEVTTIIPLTPRSLNWYDLKSTVCWHCERHLARNIQPDTMMQSSFDEDESDGCDSSEESSTSDGSDDESEDESVMSSDGSDSDDDGDDGPPSQEHSSDVDFVVPYIQKINAIEVAHPESRQIFESRAYIADGYFCSFRCAKGWAIEKGLKAQTENALFFKDVTGEPISEYMKISPAPPRRALQRYGGPLSYNEFDHFTDRNTHNAIRSIRILNYPTISMRHQYLEEIRYEDIDQPNATSTIILEQNSDIVKRRKRKRMNLIMSPSHLDLNNRMLQLQRRSARENKSPYP